MEIAFKNTFICLNAFACLPLLGERIGQLRVGSCIVKRNFKREYVLSELALSRIGILYPSHPFSDYSSEENPKNVGKQKSSVVSNFFYKQPTSESNHSTHNKSNPTQSDHKVIKLIHLLKGNVSPLEVGFRGLNRVSVALMGKEPPVPKQRQHHMGEEKHKQTSTRTKDAKTHEHSSTNALIAIKLHLDLRNFFQRSFDRCIGCISHLFHPFISHFTTKHLQQMEIIQSFIQQNPRCVALLTTSKERYP